jgi:MoxR-like ATPase
MHATDVVTLRSRLRAQIERTVVGQGAAADLLLVALLARGHVLLHGVPGLAKTLLARTFAAALALEFRRIQFTPDLMPGDVLGTNLFDFRSNAFHLTKGPIFTQILLADEINRTPPKTQAALLQAMQEREVTLDGATHDLGPGFFVVATQNPLEQEGTYPLPEAQLDRFLLRVTLDYPGRDHEREIVATHGTTAASPKAERLGIEPVADLAALEALRERVGQVRLEGPLVDYVVDLVRATREAPALACGASPRAASMLAAAARALAAVEGREFVIPDDVKRLAVPCLAHRVVLSPAAEIEGLDAATALRQVVDRVAAPR